MPGPSKHCSGRNEWRECRMHLETGLCLVVMCQFITFCDSASCLLRAFPLFVQLLSSIEGNAGYINNGDSLRKSLWEISNAHHVLTTSSSQFRRCRGEERTRWDRGASGFIVSLTKRGRWGFLLLVITCLYIHIKMLLVVLKITS